jgi:hypothetical protein
MARSLLFILGWLILGDALDLSDLPALGPGLGVVQRFVQLGDALAVDSPRFWCRRGRGLRAFARAAWRASLQPSGGQQLVLHGRGPQALLDGVDDRPDPALDLTSLAR